MPSIDRSGRAHATRQQVRVIYSQHKIEEQALNEGATKRMNSNGASPGASTIFYSAGAASGTGEELAAVLLANSSAPLPPTAATNVFAENYLLNQDTVFFVSWIAPTGGSPPTLYTIRASPGDIVLTSDPALGQFVVFGKSNGIIIGTTYTFVVTATNSAGTSPPSAPSAPLKAITYPDPPTGVSATDGELGQSTISWTPPAYDGDSPILAYTAYSYSTQDPVVHSASVDGASSSVVVPGLINGFQYRFVVTSFNSFGESQPSAYSPEITPIGPPTPPLNVVATAGPGNAVVTWDAPESTGGEPIVGYIITSDPPGYTEDLNPLPRQITTSPLTSGTTYTFTLVAVNIKGLSLPSAPSNPVIPLAPPDPPTNVVAVPENSAVSITWDDPVSDGGSPILSYTVTSSPGNIILLSVQSPTLFQNLINGTEYTFTVYATNQIGDSILSIPSLPVIPATFPTYPLNPTAVAGNGEAQVSWDAPESNGGSPIINYTVITEPADIAPQTTPDASTTLLVTGLTNGTSYTFTVYATNIMGNSFISVSTQPVTPS
jgi:hypothetical protein